MQWLHRAVCQLALLLLFSAALHAQPDAVLLPIGGSGGSQFTARCPQGEVLTGFDLRAGDDIDAIRPICIPGVAGQFHAYPVMFGGSGGRPIGLVCPNDFPVVSGVDIDWEGMYVNTVNRIALYCGLADGSTPQSAFPSAVHNSPLAKEDCGLLMCESVSHGSAKQRCPSGLIGVGISGRAGDLLDALGLICGAPPVVAAPAAPKPVVKAAARVKLPPIDLNALHARGAEIANAEPLAAKLRTEQGEGPARRGFEIGLAASEWHTSQGPGKQQIHDLLSPSEQRAYDTAVTFALALYRQKIADFALQGAAIASADPQSAEFRSLQAEGAARRGFDIGLAAAEGQTAQGPGKQKILEALPPDQQAGYAAAVAFSIDRNNNVDLAANGATIAEADPIIAMLRTADSDVLYTLGFDIATGLFGDPALGAAGNTASGPGSLRIRDSLSPAGQRGFNAAMGFHLNRKYTP